MIHLQKFRLLRQFLRGAEQGRVALAHYSAINSKSGGDERAPEQGAVRFVQRQDAADGRVLFGQQDVGAVAGCTLYRVEPF